MIANEAGLAPPSIAVPIATATVLGFETWIAPSFPACCGATVPRAFDFTVLRETASPLPLSETLGLAPLYVTLAAALDGPVTVGAKTTSNEQRRFGAMVWPTQLSPVSATAKGAPALTAAMVAGIEPLFVSVTFLGLLMPVASRLPNLSVAGAADKLVVATAVGVAVAVATTVIVAVADAAEVAVAVGDGTAVAVVVALAFGVAVKVVVGVVEAVAVTVAVVVAVTVAVVVAVREGVAVGVVGVEVSVGEGVKVGVAGTRLILVIKTVSMLPAVAALLG